jgi:hypothetical protein
MRYPITNFMDEKQEKQTAVAHEKLGQLPPLMVYVVPV